MSNVLKDRLASCTRSETVVLSTLDDLEVEIKKQTVGDAKRLAKINQKDPLKVAMHILTNFVFVDGEPIVGPNDEETVGQLTAEMIEEISTKFAEVNGQDIEELKKKATS